MEKPNLKPNCPHFSSGPCAKRPNWSVEALKDVVSGRSHRSPEGKARLQAVIDLHRKTLAIPDTHRIAIVPASDTGAVEMALWSLLGPRGVDVFSWEAFGQDWLKDITEELKIKDVRSFKAAYGELPDLSQADPDRDIVFTWNGTTSGACIPSHDWISDKRTGLTICDATSAVFAYEMEWDKLDVTTWSWQKVTGGEGAHGMLVLSPRAVQRLETYEPVWPIPKIFRMTKKGELNEGLFKGETINTPSMLAVEDCYDSLKWVESLGGQAATIARSKENMAVIDAWVQASGWADFLVKTPDIRSRTSVCLAPQHPVFMALDEDGRQTFIKDMTKLLAQENVALDIASYRSAPAGLRIWCGATVEASDLTALCPWLDWAFATTLKSYTQ